MFDKHNVSGLSYELLHQLLWNFIVKQVKFDGFLHPNYIINSIFYILSILLIEGHHRLGHSHNIKFFVHREWQKGSFGYEPWKLTKKSSDDVHVDVIIYWVSSAPLWNSLTVPMLGKMCIWIHFWKMNVIPTEGNK